MLRRVCHWCGTKSTGRWCTCCDADLDAQEQEIKREQARWEAEARQIALEEAEDPLEWEARESAEAHLDSIRDDLTPEQYAAELERLTREERQRLYEQEGADDEDA